MGNALQQDPCVLVWRAARGSASGPTSRCRPSLLLALLPEPRPISCRFFTSIFPAPIFFGESSRERAKLSTFWVHDNADRVLQSPNKMPTGRGLTWQTTLKPQPAECYCLRLLIETNSGYHRGPRFPTKTGSSDRLRPRSASCSYCRGATRAARVLHPGARFDRVVCRQIYVFTVYPAPIGATASLSELCAATGYSGNRKGAVLQVTLGEREQERRDGPY